MRTISSFRAYIMAHSRAKAWGPVIVVALRPIVGPRPGVQLSVVALSARGCIYSRDIARWFLELSVNVHQSSYTSSNSVRHWVPVMPPKVGRDRFVKSRPKIDTIRSRFFEKFSLKGSAKVGVFDNFNDFIIFTNDENYNQVFYKRITEIAEQQMWMQKYTPDFKPEEDLPIVPV
ncbi:hypothetical protein HAX54_004014 [Datura stramonium]|uniref:Uncharacterized protein n=1 Tax=Datura stramonium TaxID=4076 RepID=A0ABS8WSJ6_DATST|nr:hypothetical protein [Datura stramonium]